MKKRFFSTFLITIAILLSLSVYQHECKAGEPSKKILRVWETETDPSAIKVFDEIIQKFEQRYPGIKIEHETISWNDLSKKLTAALATGDVPDLVHLEPFMVSSLYEKKLLAPIDDVIKAIGEDDIYDSVKKLQYFDGHYYGIAYAIGTTYFSYRKDWSKEKGLNVPKTWNEYLNFVKTLTDKSKNRYGVILPGGSPFFVDQLTAELVASNGGYLFEPNGKPAFTNKKVVEVLAFWKELSKYASPEWTSESYIAQFRSYAMGTGATVPVTYARASKQIDKDAPAGANDPEHFAVMIQPVGPSGNKSYATIDCEPWSIFASSKAINEAKEFLKFFYQKENYLRYTLQVPIHLTPILRSVAESKEYMENDFVKKWKPWQETSLTMIRENRVRPILLTKDYEKDLPFLMELQGSRILTDMVLAVTIEGKSPEAAAKEAQQKAEDLITKMGYKKW